MLLLSAVGSINWGFAVLKNNSLRTFYNNHKLIASFIYIILGLAGIISLGFLIYIGIKKGTIQI